MQELVLNMRSMAFKIFSRDWRSGEVKVLFFALMIAVAAMVAIGVITDRIQRAMGEQASEFLGADYSLSSPRAIPESWISRASEDGLQTTQEQSFSTVISTSDKFQLVSVRALEGNYPLKGQLEIAQKAFVAGTKLQGKPEQGTAWVEPRVLSLLELKVGDAIEFGAISLQVSAVIVSGPGQVSEVFNVAPRIIINQKDVAKAEIIQPGSRVSYGLLIAGEVNKRDAYVQWLKPKMNLTQRLIGGKEGTPALQSSLQRAETFLRLASLISVVLAGVAIAVAAGRFSRRHYDYAAIYRCLGMQIRQVHQLYFWQLSIIGVIGAGLGVLLGLLIQQTIVMQFADYLPKPMVSVGVIPVVVGALSGLVVLMGFALPAFFQIAKVSPLRVLRKELIPQPVSSWIIYLLSMGSMALLMWWQSQSWTLVGILLVVAIIAYLLIRLIAWLIFKLGIWLGKKSSPAVRYGLGQLKRYPAFTISQITAFGMAFIVMVSTVLIRTELIDEWKNQLPEGAPNHFLINLQESEIEPLNQILSGSDVQTSGIYPMVRGRVVKLNNEPVDEVLSKEQFAQARALRRELNLTWMEQLPNANKVVKGNWWEMGSDKQSSDSKVLLESKNAESEAVVKISISTEIQKMMDLKVGDQLGFDIGGLTINGEITNVREIQWDSFQPNFFIIFEAGALKDFPASYITSFHLSSEQKPLLNNILATMPSTTIIELDKIMTQVQSILNQVTMAIEFIMLFVLLAGIAVLYAVLQANRDERLLSATLLKTLGAQRSFIRSSLLAELALLGIFSGLLGVIGSEILVATLYERALQIEPVMHPWVWLSLPIIAGVFLCVAGWWGLRALLNQPASQVLRQL